MSDEHDGGTTREGEDMRVVRRGLGSRAPICNRPPHRAGRDLGPWSCQIDDNSETLLVAHQPVNVPVYVLRDVVGRMVT